MYSLRDKQGILRLKLDHKMAKKTMIEAEGHFREYQTKDKPKKVVFEFDEDQCFTIAGITLYYWQGEVLIPD